jgi:hypothetical protein
MAAALHARAITFFATSGEKPWKTRRSGVRSSGGQVSAISAMSQSGTPTQRRAVAVFPLRMRKRLLGQVNVPPFEVA